MKLSIAVLSLVASTALAFRSIGMPPSTHHRMSPKLKTKIGDSVEDAIAAAQKACAEDPTSGECKVAWEIVEELEAADSHTAGMAPPQQVSRQAAYASVLSSFDMLEQDSEKQMEQLKALTDQLAELDVTDPAVSKLGELAVEMKQALVKARASLPKSI